MYSSIIFWDQIKVFGGAGEGQTQTLVVIKFLGGGLSHLKYGSQFIQHIANQAFVY